MARINIDLKLQTKYEGETLAQYMKRIEPRMQEAWRDFLEVYFSGKLKQAIDSFYADYTPRIYERTGNLANSYLLEVNTKTIRMGVSSENMSDLYEDSADVVLAMAYGEGRHGYAKVKKHSPTVYEQIETIKDEFMINKHIYSRNVFNMVISKYPAK